MSKSLNIKCLAKKYVLNCFLKCDKIQNLFFNLYNLFLVVLVVFSKYMYDEMLSTGISAASYNNIQNYTRQQV